MKKLLIPTILAILTSCYIFPFSLTFLPFSWNVKILLAAFGIAVFGIKCIQNHSIYISKQIIYSSLFAFAFSIWCLFCITINKTDDTTYVDYWTSFFTWIFGAYGLYVLMKSYHEKVDLARVIKYITIVGVGQCAIALMIDNIPFFERVVKAIVAQGYDFYERDGRLYGIGCALDPAGVRFSVFLALIAHEIAKNSRIINNQRSLITYLIAFIIITVIGSMISRTTIVGAALGLLYLAVSYVSVQRGGYIPIHHLRLYGIFVVVMSLAVVIGTFLYNTNDIFHSYLRFGFEGFFNWAETGEFTTTSTNKLETMWVWPTDMHTWIYGSGRYGVFEWGSDIGYCLFTLYCGLPGLIIYSVYFIYNHLSLNRKFKNFFFLSLLLIAITFIVWSKVATDIFFIDALLFCIDGDKGIEEPESEEELATEITA